MFQLCEPSEEDKNSKFWLWPAVGLACSWVIPPGNDGERIINSLNEDKQI